jgi:hypothetical protein
MTRPRKQARSHRVSIRAIVASREFARGFDEVRNGLPQRRTNSTRSSRSCARYSVAGQVTGRESL